MTYVTELRCESETCDLRETTVITHDGDKPESRVWHCAACGSLAKRRRRLSWGEYREEQSSPEAFIKRLSDWC